ncbi:unnamed protein product [Adineta steineri]|uniref:RBR-type E3 ubiquitin transferase n=1 Tax=Adineta steineri TaxID=433720 RepID=A0A818SVV8_9BILA|nr:unnamed protein product [Adineta steineri]CAF1228954.1 unnamed protein product [Adineta steineri]CAF3673259.1 unnamed protein product [Adineta steineri]CAF3687831.1 unnamed protein product [Adineta steineri]CAF3842651.1 unnamed protein product [Adineta steineri]
MTNSEKQSDEIFALQSIFDKKFRLVNNDQYEISIEFNLNTPIAIQFNNQTAIIQYLPPLTLIIHYHDEYPSNYPPSFILSCFYFSKINLQKLCQKLDNYPFHQGEVCVYDWIELIKLEINNDFIFHTKYQEQENDPRALNGYTNENVEKIFQYLINYNHERENEQFQNQLQTCLICTDIIRGLDCIRLHRCRHFYCRSCLNNYIQINLNNGQFGEKIHCPQNECMKSLLPTDIKQILGNNNDLYERYERLTLQHSLELMNDILWCPRCQHPVLVNNDVDDNLASCNQCYYTFCKKCKEIFHSQTLCRLEYIIQQLQLQKEKEYQRIQREKEEALVKLAQIEREKKSAIERKTVAQKYRQIVLKLSDEQVLLEEVLNAERIESLNTQYCPNCRVRIEKNGGCSHMHCSRCNHHFTWQTITKSESSNNTTLIHSFNQNGEQIESVKEELNKIANIVDTSKSDENKEIHSDQEEEDNQQISIDNRSVLGSAIVNRVKQCPYKQCKRYNAKIGEDNWIVCNGCMKQYCFICRRQIYGKQHFKKKCQRFTPI